MRFLVGSFATVLLLAAFSLGQLSESKEPPAQQKKAETPQDRPTRIRVSAGVAERLLVKRVEPEYPGDVSVKGTVILHVIIGKEGDVQSIQLVTGHPMLAPSAINAVKQWKYKPFLLNGEPLEVDTTVVLHFELHKG